MTASYMPLINLHDRDQLRDHSPIMIAHRGGVIAPDAPENSRRALELAAQQGYDMVELDVRPARDGTPVLFHGSGGVGNMQVDCGVQGHIGDYTAAELETIRYRGTNETILSLEEALNLCAAWGMGIMLDIKTVGIDPLPPTLLQTIALLLDKNGLDNATMTLSQRPEAQQYLPAATLRPIRARTLSAVLRDPSTPADGRYWFDDPDSVADEQLHELRRRGILTIACINSFRYPQHSYNQLEGSDIRRMQQIPVDGYQIDSCYGQFFTKLRTQSADA